MPRAGILTVVGKPNAGKSTLLNRIVGQKLSIVSPKPQSTRDCVVGIVTTDDVQLVILDTPGLLNPRYALQQAMRANALRAVNDADVILYVADATEGCPADLPSVAGIDDSAIGRQKPVLVALNKIDVLSAVDRERLAADCSHGHFLSAKTGYGVDSLLAAIREMLPESPFLYPEDEISTQTIRFFVGELVREAAFEQLEDELPYSVACRVEEFREQRTPVYIRAELYVERDSQKRILIGDKGQRIREIGRVARAKIEEFLNTSVYLDLWVKVLPNWQKNAHALSRLGYRLPQERST